MDNWISFGEGFLLIFALNDQESWKTLLNHRDRILSFKRTTFVPMVIVGNKMDLEKERIHKYEEIKANCDQMNCEYIETSADVKIINIVTKKL